MKATYRIISLLVLISSLSAATAPIHMRSLEPLDAEDWQLLFGKQPEEVTQISEGFSGALVYKVLVGGSPRLVRQSAELYGSGSWAQEYAIQKAAAELKLGPAVLQAQLYKNLVVGAFIENQGFDQYLPHAPEQRLRSIAGRIRTLHGLPIQESYQERRTSDLFAWIYAMIPENFPESRLRGLLDRAYQTAWPTDARVVSHNDLHPRNFLYDGQKLWLIDWDLAGPSHPYYDLAYFACTHSLSKAEGLFLLEAYLQAPPKEHDVETFHDLRRFVYGYLAAGSLTILVPHAEHVQTDRRPEDISLYFQYVDRAVAQPDNLDALRDLYGVVARFLELSADY